MTVEEGTKLVVQGIKDVEGIPEEMLPGLEHFITEYLTATSSTGIPSAIQRITTCLKLGATHGLGPSKYTFETSHTALRSGPFDYYAFGNDFFRPCVDPTSSFVGGVDNLKQAMSQIEAGDNVVFLANHQSEADPQVVSLMLESVGYAEEASKITFLAGHKVTTDPLAIPFSMGRNLLCIHSKKHIDSDPTQKDFKQKQNLKTMGSMLEMLKVGSRCLWVAPSGGRDRRNVETGDVPIAGFDSKTIDMFRLMARKSKKECHFYPFSMVSYDVCPPPDSVEAGVGELRNVRYGPVGVWVGEETKNEGGLEARHKFCENAEEECEKNYRLLRKEIYGE
ncbi:hypothetical protein TrST_g638 [Triparma strigata]|nr:hypothetical protein TrST_g638 [Triparma strigata]